jgi:LysR family transcriptional regulator, regulator for bpeEF and oprC
MELEPTRIFVKVVQQGSFSRAAELLRLPKSTVSRAISRLEAESGTKLLLRTTRSLTLTSAGRAFYESCTGPVQALENARKALDGQDNIVVGNVRLTASEDFGSHVVSPAIGELMREHPGLTFDLHYTDNIVDLVKGGYDLAVRIGRLKPSRLKAKRFGDIAIVAVASPEYLKQRPAIKKPQDLAAHDCMVFTPRSPAPVWTLRSAGKSVSAPIKPRLVVNQMVSLMGLATQGAGVTFLPLFLCRDELQSGRLVRVLPDWHTDSVPVSIVSPTGSANSSRLKLISDKIAGAINKALK